MEYSQLAVFKGTYHHRIDAKGRLPIPAVFRRALGDDRRVVVTLLDQCLAVYTEAEWARLESQLAALPAFSVSVSEAGAAVLASSVFWKVMSLATKSLASTATLWEVEVPITVPSARTLPE